MTVTTKLTELDHMARRAWRDHGIVILWPDRIRDDWDRQHVLNLAGKLYGPRATMVPASEIIPIKLRQRARKAVRS